MGAVSKKTVYKTIKLGASAVCRVCVSDCVLLRAAKSPSWSLLKKKRLDTPCGGLTGTHEIMCTCVYSLFVCVYNCVCEHHNKPDQIMFCVILNLDCHVHFPTISIGTANI